MAARLTVPPPFPSRLFNGQAGQGGGATDNALDNALRNLDGPLVSSIQPEDDSQLSGSGASSGSGLDDVGYSGSGSGSDDIGKLPTI